jgi:selenocysteine-specific elongation factor
MIGLYPYDGRANRKATSSNVARVHVIGTAGHVDHGKSALVERLTGVDPDRLAEEKRRGLTIDLGFALLELPSGREIGIVDVPGHERFIKNMLAGAGGISMCLFVVAANEGWMPQSSEHLAVLEILGISRGVIAVTKSDTVDEAVLEMAVEEVREHIEGTSLHGAPIVRCSARTGAGIDDLVATLDEMVGATPPLPDLGRPRLWVDRAFVIAGAGTVVTGTLAGGSFSVGDEVQIVPAGMRVRIRSIESHNRPLERIGPGNRTALNLAGSARNRIARGHAVVREEQWQSSRMVDAHVSVLPARRLGRDHELTDKGSHLLYVGSAETPVTVKLFSRPVGAGASGFARLHLRDHLPLARGDRFVLRDAGRVSTFGGGVVLDPLPPPRVGKKARMELLQRLRDRSAHEAAAALVEDQGRVPAPELLLRAGTADLPASAVRLGGTVASMQEVAKLEGEVEAIIREHHHAYPLEPGMDREAVRARTGLAPPELDDLLDHMDSVEELGPHVKLRFFEVHLTPEQQEQKSRLLKLLEGAGFSPPLHKELDASPELLRALTRSQELIPVGDFYLTRRQAESARLQVRAGIDERGPLSVAQIRDLLGTSRKYAVPLCEWLDATGATRRRGDLRDKGPVP